MTVSKQQLLELASTYNDLVQAAQASLTKDFAVDEGQLDLVDVFVGHKEFGDAVLTRFSGNGNLFLAPFNDSPSGVKLAPTDQWRQIVQKYHYAEAPAGVGGTTPSIESFTETANLHIAEGDDPSKPLVLVMRIIKEGFGNSKHNHYYSKDLLEKSAQQFVGTKMYITEHKAGEVNVRNEVAQILEAKFDETQQGVVARIGVFDPTFAENVRNRAALGILEGLQCSINAVGTVYERDTTVNGRTGKVVKEFTKVNTVDFVSAAGAGGQGIAIE